MTSDEFKVGATEMVRGQLPVDVAQIQASLERLPQVHEAVVLNRNEQTGERRMVAYVVSAGPFDPERLHAQLTRMLPEGLAPITYVQVSSLPTTATGEADERTLASLGLVDSDLASAWEQKLLAQPEVEQAAVVVQQEAGSIPPIHLSDLLPGSRSSSVHNGVEARVGSAQTEIAHERPAPGVPAIVHGEALRLFGRIPTTLPQALERAAQRSPQQGIVHIESDGADVFQSYPALLDEAARIMAGLRGLGLEPQHKVLFQLERSRDFLPAFWACQLGGFVPVPVSIAPSYSGVNSSLSKLLGAIQLLGGPIILTDGKLASAIRSLRPPGTAKLRVAEIDDLRRCDAASDWYRSESSDTAILLLTSGSTGVPKAVMQSHGNLLHRSAATSQMNRFSDADVSLNWMPLDHVGGIVMFHLRDVYLGCQQIQAPTELILQDPLRWLDLIERFRATITWAPNFAFGLVNARESALRTRRWDLSSMRFILNGGEAIVAKTARRFLELLRPYGLPGACMHPAWGMSETCSGVAYSDRFSVETTSDADSVVEVGAPIPGFSMRIVDAEGGVVPESTIGRLQVKGGTVTPGYYGSPDQTGQAFSADGWFETGDLGFLRDGRLTIAGREKDAIIVNGVNYHGHEIEAAVEEVPGVAVSFTAACSVRGELEDTDKVAIFFHPTHGDDGEISRLVRSIRQNVVRKIGINPDYLVPVAQQDIPKTAIGKIQRAQLSQRFKRGEFDAAVKRIDLLTANSNTVPAWFYRRVWRRRQRAVGREQEERRPVLVFVDGSGVGERLCEELDRVGWPNLRVEEGAGFSRIATNRYRIDCRAPDDFVRLFSSIEADGVRLGRIVHLWTFQSALSGIQDVERIEHSLDRGVYSLIFLIQALSRSLGVARPARLLVVSSNSHAIDPGDDVVSANGTLGGFLKTIPQEIAWMDCRHLDLPADEGKANVARIIEEMQIAGGDREVAFRQGARLVPRLQALDFSTQRLCELPIKRGGMYVVSGGLGGIGTEIAGLLLRDYEARLLLLGRTPLESGQVGDEAAQPLNAARSLAAYRGLQGLSGEVRYAAVDIGNLEELRQAVDRARSDWNAELDGVIHLAGTYHEKLLEEETRQSFADVLHSKVRGAWALSQLLEDKPGKVFIAFSSLAGYFGGALVGAYSAANSFLDAFAQHLRHRSKFLKSHCLAWSTWDETGMSQGYTMKELIRSRGYVPLSKRHGLQSFAAALRCAETSVAIGLDGSNPQIRWQVDAPARTMNKLCAFVTQKDGQRLAEESAAASVRDRFGTRIHGELRLVPELPRTDRGEIDRAMLARSGYGGDQVAEDRIAPRTDLERRIAAFWQDVLMTSQVGVHDNFFDLGGNSLLATQVASRIESAYQVRLSLRTMFEEPTVAKQAATIERELSQAPVAPGDRIPRSVDADAGRTLEKLDQLSDEEVSALLRRALARDDRR